jgi:hypothetical protein
MFHIPAALLWQLIVFFFILPYNGYFNFFNLIKISTSSVKLNNNNFDTYSEQYIKHIGNTYLMLPVYRIIHLY